MGFRSYNQGLGVIYMNIKTLVVFGAAFLLSMTHPVSAGVSMKNGNFFIGYTDMIYPGGFEPKIERVYNSKTTFDGIFGYGWGNEYEVYLTVSADGSVVVHEYGGGAENRFSPKAFDEKELNKAVEMIADAARKDGHFGNNDQLKDYKKNLRGNAFFRNDEWEKYRSKGVLKPRELSNNSQLFSNRFSYQYITKLPGFYIRTFDSGKVEKYNDKTGKLAKIQDKNGNFIEFTYGDDGKLEKLADNFTRKMFFKFNNTGKVKSIQGENSKEVVYEYNKLGELISSQDAEGNLYKFEYSKDERHNMTQIAYADKTTMEISYYSPEQHDNVKSIRERDKTLTEYTYKSDPADNGHLSIEANVKDMSNKTLSSSKYEYYLRYKPDGQEWTYKLVSLLDGDRSETTYNECCGLPLLIKRGKEETSFQYDSKGHVTKKITPWETTELKYDTKVSKVSRVEKYSKNSKKKKMEWSEFHYDDKGNLDFAKNSEGKGVKLIYDAHGRILSMVDHNKRVINFKYNENSKPIEITDPSLGTINVQYTNSGEIKKVDSKAGRKIALQVTAGFQNLLDIIRPAGVTLSF